MALAQNGAGCHILSISLYNYISGMSISDIIATADEVPDFSVREAINEVIFPFLIVNIASIDLFAFRS